MEGKRNLLSDKELCDKANQMAWNFEWDNFTNESRKGWPYAIDKLIEAETLLQKILVSLEQIDSEDLTYDDFTSAEYLKDQIREFLGD